MNSAARMIPGTKNFSHITPVLVNLHWLPVDYRVKFKLLCLTYKALHGLAPIYLSDLLQQYSPPRSLRSMEHELLCASKVHTKIYGEQAFAYAAPKLYNELPVSLRQSATLGLEDTPFQACLWSRASIKWLSLLFECEVVVNSDAPCLTWPTYTDVSLSRQGRFWARGPGTSGFLCQSLRTLLHPHYSNCLMIICLTHVLLPMC